MCWVSVLRPSALMPKSVCSTSPRRITGLALSPISTPLRCTLTEGWNQSESPSSLTRWRIHQTTSSVRVVPGVITRLEKAVWMMSCTTCCIFT